MPRDEHGLPGAGDTTALAQIARLQRDGMVLLTFLAERPNRALVETSPREVEQIDPGLMIADPAMIEAEASRFSALVRSVDLLGRAAAPATATSIRLTRAFLSGAVLGSSRREGQCADQLRRCLHGIQAGVLLAGLVAIFLLLKADEGRRIVGQLAVVRADLDRSYGELWKLDRSIDFEVRRFPPGPDESVTLRPAGPDRPAMTATELCWPLAPSEPDYRLVPVKPQAQALCSQLLQQKKREMLVYSQISGWNCDMMRLNPMNWIVTLWRWASGRSWRICEQAPADLLPGHAEDWRRTELRTNEAVQGLSGYLLPLLLGGIGGGVYVLRRMGELLRTSTLTAGDGLAAVGRIVLAAVFGGLLAMVFSVAEPVTLGSVSLTIAAWAFFLGYALETVLKTLDAAIEGVIGRLRPAEAEKRTVPVAPSTGSAVAGPAAGLPQP